MSDLVDVRRFMLVTSIGGASREQNLSKQLVIHRLLAVSHFQRTFGEVADQLRERRCAVPRFADAESNLAISSNPRTMLGQAFLDARQRGSQFLRRGAFDDLNAESTEIIGNDDANRNIRTFMPDCG